MSSPVPPPPPPGPPAPPVFGQAPPPQPGNDVKLGVLVGVVAFALLLAGIVGWRLVADDDTDAPLTEPTASGSPDPELPATDAALERFYAQDLDWKACGRSQCATMTVPLDYDKPGGTTIRIAVLKVPAQEPDRRVGALVVNPGGPGGSGVNYAAAGSLQFGNALSDRFDIVGFDPRGVGQSTPLRCLDTAGLDRMLAFDPDPDDQPERDEMDALIRGFGQSCLDNSGELARHMSTEEVVRDLDILRAALGEAKLDYLGASYGTAIGATYADLFPDHVGRFVLDGAIDPSMSNEQLALEQAGGFETALRAYATECVERRDCFLGSTPDAALDRIRGLLRSLDATPLPTGDPDRPLTQGLGMTGIWLPLYLKAFWPRLDAALEEALEQGRGSTLLALSDLYTSRGPDSYTDNSIDALYAVNCLDHSDSIPTSEVPAKVAAFEKVSPTFGRAFAFSLSTCANWPVQSGEVSEEINAPGAPPIVVIGTTRDPATPLRWAQALAEQLESGLLITRDGDGHTGFQQGNDCVDDAVERFLITGTAPRADLNC